MDCTSPRLRSRLDRIGIALSALCVAHCVLGLALVAGIGLAGLGAGAVLLHPAVHEVGLVVATLVAALAIGLGGWHRRPGPTLPVALVGLGCMAAALLVGHGAREAVLTVLGVVLLGIAHFASLRRA